MSKLKNTIQVAIDGPAGAGKSTVARTAAKNLGYIYIDTGALYRAVALYCLEHTPSLSEPGVTAALPEIHISVEAGKNGEEQQVFVNGENVTQNIRRPDISAASSKTSAYPAVREFLLDLQRDLADTADCIMDGRDIASTVLPNADVKIFLTASAEERTRRRKLELEQKGEHVDFDALLAEINKRDYDDSHRAVSPLTQVAEATLIDTGGLTFEQSVERVTETILNTVKTTKV